MPNKKTVSIIIPVYNEEESILILFEEIISIKQQLTDYSLEIIFVNDGSTDSSQKVLQKIKERNETVKTIFLQRNYGQTAAMSAGIDNATGEIIVFLDADLQNDPADIPKLLSKLESGCDFVNGWRKHRQDKILSKKIPSWLANKLISWIFHVGVHDIGCTLKACKSEFLKKTHLYGEMHRFIPIYARWAGAKLDEVVVNHRPRRFGNSKYGLSRIFKVIPAIITLKYLEYRKIRNRP